MMTWALLVFNTLPAILVPAILPVAVGVTTAGRTRRLAVAGLVVVAAGVVLGEILTRLRRSVTEAAGAGFTDVLSVVTQAVYVLTALAGGVLILLAVLRRRPTASAGQVP